MDLSQSGERPERQVESLRFDTIPSSPELAGVAEDDGRRWELKRHDSAVYAVAQQCEESRHQPRRPALAKIRPGEDQHRRWGQLDIAVLKVKAC